MSCQLDKVLKAINEVAGEIKNPQAIKQLNELKSALTEFAGAMESNTVKSYKNLITDIEGTTKVETKVTDKKEVTTESKLKEELLVLLDAYTSSKKTRTGGGYTKNVKQKNGYLEANVIEEATPLIPINKVNPQTAKELQGCSK